MQISAILLLMKVLFTSLLISFSALASCPKPWVCEHLNMVVPYTTVKGIKFSKPSIRAGYLPHQGEFKGNILYYQGLGDSMLNHRPLFSKLSVAGFRVIAFDYMGQGGSSGSMNQTRIEYIPWIGNRVWERLAFNKSNFPERIVMGWSTGGLAAYFSAMQNKVDKVILIAPGIVPRKIVGEGLWNDLPNEITLETLTTDIYFDRDSNPHVDSIKPDSPLKVPFFSLNLLKTAKGVQTNKIPSRIKGLVLLSGESDTYVNAKKTLRVLSKNAQQFEVISYPDALHEIDNERREIREVAHQDILNFLNSNR
jgi:alpha-beta hydrolase superfamily lysophospholipase